jgi:alpha-glucosidase
VPLPWSGLEPPFGFSSDGVVPWLEQPDGWGGLTVAAQDGDEGSILNLYREGLRLRRAAPWGAVETVDWLASPDQVLAFARGPRFVCLTNFGAESVPLPAGTELLLASNKLEGGAVEGDTTVWLRQADTISTDGSGKEGR